MIGCTVISMENYRTGVDDGNDLDFIDFDLLVQNLEVHLTCFLPSLDIYIQAHMILGEMRLS